MYYFKIQPALPQGETFSNGVHVLRVCKSNSMTSICVSTSPSVAFVTRVIGGGRATIISHTATPVNKSYFKKAMEPRVVHPRGVVKQVNLKEESSMELVKILVMRTGQKLSQWILALTKKSPETKNLV